MKSPKKITAICVCVTHDRKPVLVIADIDEENNHITCYSDAPLTGPELWLWDVDNSMLAHPFRVMGGELIVVSGQLSQCTKGEIPHDGQAVEISTLLDPAFVKLCLATQGKRGQSGNSD